MSLTQLSLVAPAPGPGPWVASTLVTITSAQLTGTSAGDEVVLCGSAVNTIPPDETLNGIVVFKGSAAHSTTYPPLLKGSAFEFFALITRAAATPALALILTGDNGSGGGGGGGHVITDPGSVTAVTSLPSIPAGGNAIGSVSINAALPAGGNTIGAVTIAAGAAVIGHVITDAGSTTVIGAGAAAIGSVAINAALPAGGNTIGAVNQAGAPWSVAIAAGAAVIGHVITDAGSTTVLGAGAAAIGSVSVNAALPAGGNTIGAVTAPGAAALALDASVTSTNTKLAGGLPAALGAGGGLKIDGSGTALPISGSVSVSNFPATQPVSGVVAVSNFPATQPVSGTVSLGAGAAAIGSVAINAAIPAGANVIGHVITDTGSTTVIGAGAAAIGSVTVTSLPSIPAGGNTIGAVTAPGAAALALDSNLTGLRGQFATSLGQATFAASPSFAQAQDKMTQFASVAVAGQLLFTGAGSIFTGQFANNGAAIVFFLFYDATSTQGAGTVAGWFSAPIAVANTGTTGIGSNTLGMGVTTGGWMQPSSTQATQTNLAVTTETVTMITSK